MDPGIPLIQSLLKFLKSKGPMNFAIFKEDMISTNFGEAAKEIKRKGVVRNGIGILEIKTNFGGNC